MTETAPPRRMANWNERYRTSEYLFGKEPNDFVRTYAHQLPGGRVVSLADGEGRNGVFLAEQGCDVTSIDSSSVASSKAQSLAAERGVSLHTVVADLLEYDLGESAWQGVVSIFFHLPSEKRKAMHARIVDALAPGGVLLLEAYTPDQLQYRTGGPPVPDMLMTLEALREEFSALEILRGEELLREMGEGRGHSGTGAVVQLIARKP